MCPVRWFTNTSTVTELLRLLLEREYELYAISLVAAATRTGNFEEAVRVFIADNYDHFAPGKVLPILVSQPARASECDIRGQH